MARRKKTSPLEDMMELVALLPWWAGVSLAVVSYLLFNHLAAAYAPAVVAKAAGQPGQMATLFQGAVIGGLANLAQYVAPMICLASAAISAWRRRQRRALVDTIAQAPAASAIDGMSWAEFEILVGEAYRLQGFRVTETGGGGPDGGVDLVLSRGGEKFLVQCKQWKAFKVGVDTVRELYGVMAARGATGGFVVTSGSFTNDAKLFSEGRNIQLVDGPRLLEMVRQARQVGAEPNGTFIPAPEAVNIHRPAPAPATERNAPELASMPGAAASDTLVHPGCPKCGSGMVRRTARSGSNAGGAFWGCSTFPTCRGVRPVD